MSAPRQALRRVAVAGDGQVGVLAAIAVRRALPQTDVLVIGTPPAGAALADRACSALPFTNRLHDRLGIAEQLLVREAGASHRLVTRYRGWGGAGRDGLAAYGAVDPRLRTGFARAWGGGPRSASGPLPAGSLGEVLAGAGRFASPGTAAGSSLTDVDYALRWNGPAYRDLLVREALRLGVRHVKGAVGAAEPDGAGGIASLALDGAEAVAADLYLDCTGPAAALLTQLPEARREDWSAFLPVRGVLFGRPAEPLVTLEDRITLAGAGWLAELGGRDGRHVQLALVEGTTGDAALAALPAEPDRLEPIEPGCRRQPWLGNVIALGDAAAQFEPLGWLNLDLAHRQVELLLDLLPGCPLDPRERAEFNRRAGLMADGVRDLLGAHYAAPGAAPFGALQRSAGLELLLDQYVRRGRVPFFEEAPLQPQEVAGLLQALGHPFGAGALARAADPGEAERARDAFAARAETALRAVPPYPAWLAGLLHS